MTNSLTVVAKVFSKYTETHFFANIWVEKKKKKKKKRKRKINVFAIFKGRILRSYWLRASFWINGPWVLLLILLCTFIKDENKNKHNWKTGHFFIFFLWDFFSIKKQWYFLSFQENICLVLIRSATQSLLSTHSLCFHGGMRKKNISILLFCGIFLWCGALACASAQSDHDIVSHNLSFPWWYEKKYFFTLILWYFLWCGALACASAQSDQDVLSPLILCSHMPRRSLFSWVSIFISIGVDSL